MKEVFIIGGGHSLKKAIENNLWDYLKDKEVWSINFAFKFMPFLPAREIWFDTHFFKNEKQNLFKLHSSGVKLYTKSHILYKDIKDINTFEANRIYDKLKPGEIFVGQMGLSGCMALDLAIKDDYKKIFLLGYDFGTSSFDDTDTHWYQDKAKEYNISSSGLHNTAVYLERNHAPNKFIRDFEYFVKYLPEIEIINVNYKSNLSYFPIMSFEQFFKYLSENI